MPNSRPARCQKQREERSRQSPVNGFQTRKAGRDGVLPITEN
jgi:hypothetical protein